MTAPLVRFILSLAVVAGCAPVVEPGETFVRLHNATGATLEDVRVWFSREPIDYGDLAPGARSDYRLAPGAYRYARVEARVNAETRVLQPIDFVGERPLGGGRFTYRLRLRPGEFGLDIDRVTRDN